MSHPPVPQVSHSLGMLHTSSALFFFFPKTPQILLMVQKYFISAVLVEENTQPIAHPLKPEQPSEKSVFFFTESQYYFYLKN